MVDKNVFAEEILVVVFDGAKARFLKREPNGRLVALSEMEAGLTHHTHEAVSDRPGRSFASTGGGVRHSIEAKHDEHKMEKHNFVHRIVKELETSLDQNKFKALAIVAPERSIGEFRTLASDKLRARVWREVPKELTQFSLHDLQSRLEPHFKPDTEIIEPPR